MVLLPHCTGTSVSPSSSIASPFRLARMTGELSATSMAATSEVNRVTISISPLSNRVIFSGTAVTTGKPLSGPSSESSVSATPSLSSSRSALLPVPSPSLSRVSLGSSGKASVLSPTPSPSVSADSLASSGKASALSPMPSPSVSADSEASRG